MPSSPPPSVNRPKRWVTYNRTNRRKYGIPPVLALYAHADGSPVLADDAATVAQKARLLAAVQLTGRLGTLTVQWRGFAPGAH